MKYLNETARLKHICHSYLTVHAIRKPLFLDTIVINLLSFFSWEIFVGLYLIDKLVKNIAGL